MGYGIPIQVVEQSLSYGKYPVLPFLRTLRTNRGSISPPGLWVRQKGVDMIRKKILAPDRIRQIEGSFGFIPHRFLTDGFLAAPGQHELLLYLFLIMAADRYGLSFYSCNSICSQLGLTVDQYLKAKDGLIEKDLIAFDGTIFQVLSLPEPLKAHRRQQLRSRRAKDPVSIAQILQQSIKRISP